MFIRWIRIRTADAACIINTPPMLGIEKSHNALFTEPWPDLPHKLRRSPFLQGWWPWDKWEVLKHLSASRPFLINILRSVIYNNRSVCELWWMLGVASSLSSTISLAFSHTSDRVQMACLSFNRAVRLCDPCTSGTLSFVQYLHFWSKNWNCDFWATIIILLLIYFYVLRFSADVGVHLYIRILFKKIYWLFLGTCYFRFHDICCCRSLLLCHKQYDMGPLNLWKSAKMQKQCQGPGKFWKINIQSGSWKCFLFSEKNPYYSFWVH